jgi:hypothetical protein
MAEGKIPPELIEEERRRLAEALREGLEAAPRKRKVVLRKVADHVERTWVSAGCFGEAVQWRLAKRKKGSNARQRRRARRQQPPQDPS